MKIVCGLGNPGGEYESHRHNVGFMVVDELARRCKAPSWQGKFEAEAAQAQVGSERVIFLKPQTFMNLSGQSVQAAMRFFKVELSDLLVIHDELDLPFARLQLKAGGGHGGHNGLRSISAQCGGDAYGRLRFGIDKPPGPNAKERVSGYVLSPFSKEEQKALPDELMRACEGAELWISQGMATAMNRFNRK